MAKNYRVLESISLVNLTFEANNLIVNGYEPAGGISSVRKGDETSYTQAMFKREDFVGDLGSVNLSEEKPKKAKEVK